MSKLITVVEFEDKEIRDMLRDKANEILGKPFQGSCEIQLLGAIRDDADAAHSLKSLSAKITFNGKAD